MNTPVLIAARNEADKIERTLEALPRNCEPIVIANGCHDNTAQIARSHNVLTLEREEAGKLPALQHAIEYLGSRALDPFITLDADSYPRVPGAWIEAMLAARGKLSPDHPAVVVGSLRFNEMKFADLAVKTFGHTAMQWMRRHSHEEGSFHGANMLLHPNTQDGLDAVLAIPHVWPGEDRALKDAVLTEGGGIIKTFDRKTRVITSGSRYEGCWRKMTDYADFVQEIHQTYLDEAPPGSVPYEGTFESAAPAETQGPFEQATHNT